MPERVTEPIINDRISQILSNEFGIDCRAERSVAGRRPDIRCLYRGFTIAIETSFERRDAEEDAKRRIDEGFADIAIALYLGGKESFENLTEEELNRRIRESQFEVKIFSQSDMPGLLRFIKSRMTSKAVSVKRGWLRVDLAGLHLIIENSIDYIIKEREIEELINEIESAIINFVDNLNSLDKINKGNVSQRIYEVLYRLYGLSPQEDPDIAFGHAGLSILLSTVFYEHVRAVHKDLHSIDDYGRSIEGLRKVLSELLRHDYKTAIETTLEILKVLPPEANNSVRSLIDLGVKLAQKQALLRRDFAGRIYHKITGDIAVRKGFATYFTEVPPAYLLAHLAVLSLLGLDERDITRLSEEEARQVIDGVGNARVGDFACGSGTLLTAAYYALTRLASALRFYHDLEDVDVDGLGKKLIEGGIYGIDALRYASQITAINLALVGPPGSITRENVYTIYLGYIKGRNTYWLGSLELLNNGKRVGGILAYIEGGSKGAVDKVSLEGSEGEFSIPDRFDVVIMNPPFTRATGRTEKFGEGRRGLFGFMTEEKFRKGLIERLDEVRQRVRNDLIEIARRNADLFPPEVKKILSGSGEFAQYLSIGQAGEGLLFLYLAYRYVRDGGVIAFVLPRNLLSGVSWFLARVLLATKFHVKYIVVSSDSERGYNFSESTSLSEVLIVAKRVDRHNDDEETTFINLLRKPSTGLEAIMLAEEIVRNRGSSNATLIEVGESRALVFRVRRRHLLENIDNWNRFALPTIEILSIVDAVQQLREGKIMLRGGRYISIPVAPLNDIISTIGIDRHQFHNYFKPIDIRTDYPVVHGGGEEVREKMIIQPNAYAFLKRGDESKEIFKNYSGKVLVPDRIRWDTAHVVAMLSQEPVLSNIFYAVKLRVPRDVEEYANKALVLWLNTTWGLLTVLTSREETEGTWSELKMAQWRLMPVLNVTSLGVDVLRRLADVFDKHADEPLGRIPEQFDPSTDENRIRLEIDKDFIKALDPSISDDDIKQGLQELYKHVYVTLKQWIGK